jgi:putative FmdB family regulatory protein
MPVYEYICQECHASFEAIFTLTEHETQEVCCPKCGSKKVEQDATEFFAVTSRKS